MKLSSTKENIRNNAIQLFKEYGYENVTIQQICKASHITKRTFYYHFDSKSTILTGLNDYLGMHGENLLSTVISQNNNVEKLWILFSQYCKNSQSMGCHLVKQLYIQSLEDNNVQFPEGIYLYPITTQLIQNAQINHEIDNSSKPEDIAYTLHHVLRSVAITWAFSGDAYDLTESFKRVFLTTLGYHQPLQGEKESD